MNKISVIILTKIRLAATIERAIMRRAQISNDILVIDSGSEDDTLTIAKLNARIFSYYLAGIWRCKYWSQRSIIWLYFCLDSDEK